MSVFSSRAALLTDGAGILQAKDQIHKLAGELAGGAASVVGVRGAALDFTQELVANIPLPIDAKMVAVARGVQVAGILLGPYLAAEIMAVKVTL